MFAPFWIVLGDCFFFSKRQAFSYIEKVLADEIELKRSVTVLSGCSQGMISNEMYIINSLIMLLLGQHGGLPLCPIPY